MTNDASIYLVGFFGRSAESLQREVLPRGGHLVDVSLVGP